MISSNHQSVHITLFKEKESFFKRSFNKHLLLIFNNLTIFLIFLKIHAQFFNLSLILTKIFFFSLNFYYKYNKNLNLKFYKHYFFTYFNIFFNKIFNISNKIKNLINLFFIKFFNKIKTINNNFNKKSFILYNFNVFLIGRNYNTYTGNIIPFYQKKLMWFIGTGLKLDGECSESVLTADEFDQLIWCNFDKNSIIKIQNFQTNLKNFNIHKRLKHNYYLFLNFTFKYVRLQKLKYLTTSNKISIKNLYNIYNNKRKINNNYTLCQNKYKKINMFFFNFFINIFISLVYSFQSLYFFLMVENKKTNLFFYFLNSFFIYLKSIRLFMDLLKIDFLNLTYNLNVSLNLNKFYSLNLLNLFFFNNLFENKKLYFLFFNFFIKNKLIVKKRKINYLKLLNRNLLKDYFKQKFYNKLYKYKYKKKSIFKLINSIKFNFFSLKKYKTNFITNLLKKKTKFFLKKNPKIKTQEKLNKKQQKKKKLNEIRIQKKKKLNEIRIQKKIKLLRRLKISKRNIKRLFKFFFRKIFKKKRNRQNKLRRKRIKRYWKAKKQLWKQQWKEFRQWKKARKKFKNLPKPIRNDENPRIKIIRRIRRKLKNKRKKRVKFNTKLKNGYKIKLKQKKKSNLTISKSKLVRLKLSKIKRILKNYKCRKFIKKKTLKYKNFFRKFNNKLLFRKTGFSYFILKTNFIKRKNRLMKSRTVLKNFKNKKSFLKEKLIKIKIKPLELFKLSKHEKPLINVKKKSKIIKKYDSIFDFSNKYLIKRIKTVLPGYYKKINYLENRYRKKRRRVRVRKKSKKKKLLIKKSIFVNKISKTKLNQGYNLFKIINRKSFYINNIINKRYFNFSLISTCNKQFFLSDFELIFFNNLYFFKMFSIFIFLFKLNYFFINVFIKKYEFFYYYNDLLNFGENLKNLNKFISVLKENKFNFIYFYKMIFEKIILFETYLRQFFFNIIKLKKNCLKYKYFFFNIIKYLIILKKKYLYFTTLDIFLKIIDQKYLLSEKFNSKLMSLCALNKKCLLTLKQRFKNKYNIFLLKKKTKKYYRYISYMMRKSKKLTKTY